MGSVLGKKICPLILIEYTIFPSLPRIIVRASRGLYILEVNSRSEERRVGKEC